MKLRIRWENSLFHKDNSFFKTLFGLVKSENHTAVSDWSVYEDNNGPDFKLISLNRNQYVSGFFSQTDLIERCVLVKDIIQDSL